MSQFSAQAEAVGRHPDRGRTILVVEDDPDIRDALQSVLEEEGFAIRTAANGKEGLDELSHMKRPCLILLDLMMPVMTGNEFLKHLGENEALSPIPVVVVSAWLSEIETAPGPRGFLDKPIDFKRLMGVVESYC